MVVDLLALVEQDGFKSVRNSTSRGGQHNGACPFCGTGDDRFRVQPHYGPYGWFACSVCRKSGTAIDYLMLKRGLSKQDALITVGWKPKDGSEPHFLTPASASASRPQWDEPPERWQDASCDFYRACQDTLWGDLGKAALDYLRGRGLKDETIKYARLGYHAKERSGPVHIWGRSVKLWTGIVIPWLYQGEVWRVTIRDERVVSGPGRYKQIAGGSNGLYLADSLELKRSVAVVTEGEFDALSVAQVCGREVAVVATGSTQGSHTPRWIGMLARTPLVLIAFDGEDKGEKAALWWLSRLDNAQRLRPWWKDANQMLQDGVDLRSWVRDALGTCPETPVSPDNRLADDGKLVQTADQPDTAVSPEGSGKSAPPMPEVQPAMRKIGTCLMMSEDGQICGSTCWLPNPYEEYVCWDCLSPIGWTRRLKPEEHAKRLARVQPRRLSNPPKWAVGKKERGQRYAG